MENVLRDVGREQKEQLDELHAVYQRRDDMYRRFRTAILRADEEEVQSRVMGWIPLSNN
jgi:shikimate kinase